MRRSKLDVRFALSCVCPRCGKHIKPVQTAEMTLEFRGDTEVRVTDNPATDIASAAGRCISALGHHFQKGCLGVSARDN
jgi:hypothetical protein